MKKILALVLVLAAVLSLSACAGYNGKSSGDIMLYSEYDAAKSGTQVVVEAYVQGTTWTEKDGQGVATIFTQDHDGAYYVYDVKCTKEAAADLVLGTKIRVTGTKNVADGAIRIENATYEVLEGMWKAPAKDVSKLLGKDDEMAKCQGQSIVIKNMEVVECKKAGGAGSDINITATVNGATMNLVVDGSRYDIKGNYEQMVAYNTLANMKAGTLIDVEGLLYWDNGAQIANLQITQKEN